MNFFKARTKKTGPSRARVARLLALTLILLACRAFPANASTSLSNGQVVTGTVSGAGVDTYTFVASSGGAFQVNVGRVGAGPTPDFGTDLYNPSGTHIGTSFNHYAYFIRETGVANGQWTVKISVHGSVGTVSYKLTVAMLPGTPGIAGSNAGGSLTPGIAVPGSIYRGDLNVFTFTGVGGALNKALLTIAGSSGVADTEFYMFKPDSTGLATSFGKNYTDNVSTATSGTYTIFLYSHAAGDYTLPYNLSVSGTGVAMPVAAKSDLACLDNGGSTPGAPNPTVGSGADAVTGPEASNPIYLDGGQPIDLTPKLPPPLPLPDQGGSLYPYIERPTLGTLGLAWGGSNPINIANSNLCETVVDYTTEGQNPLSLVRYYNNLSYTRNLTPTLLGYNCRTNYDRYLLLASSVLVAAERPDGQVINFRCNVTSHVCTPDPDENYTLSYSGSTWTLTDPDDTVETYSASGTLGTLSSIKLRNGYTQTMNYTAGVLTSVSDSYSRSLSFTYTGGFLTGVTTPDSATLTYGYIAFTSSSLLQSVTYNTSPSTKLTYLYENSSLPYSITGITDENNHRYATWTYDGSNRVTQEQFGNLGANQTSISYSSAGNTITGPLGIQDTYKTTTMQNVPKTTSISRAANGTVAGATTSIRYDSNGYMNSYTDWNGNNTSWTNNSRGLPSSVTFASGTTNAQTSSLTYDVSWPNLPHTISTTGMNANFTYDSSGNLLTRKLTDTTSTSSPYSTNGQTRTWTYTYNGTGQLLTVQMPRTDVTAKTTYTYNGGTLVTTTDAMGHVTTVTEAQGGGLPTKIRDPNGTFTTLAWNNRNWMTSSVIGTSAGNLTTSYTYDSAGELTKRTLPDSSYLSYGYDNAHRMTSITNALGETSAITYNSAGEATQTLWKNSSGVTKRSHTATYDALGRLLTSVGGQSQSTSYTYDSNSNIKTITNPRGFITYESVDELNRLTRIEDGALSISTISYDSHSRPLTVTDPKSNKTTYVYDGFGDTIQQNTPDTLKTIYYYDGDFNVTGVNQSGINFSSATYDKLDRLTGRTYSGDSSLNTAIYYDSSGHGFGVGHLTGGTDATGTFSRSYDERGNITTDSKTISSQTYSTGYTYESAGRLSSITYASSGWLIGYKRDAAGQITYVSATQPMHSAVNLAKSITHMPFGPASSWTYNNGVTDTRTFDQDYRMTSVKDVGSSNIQYLSFGYDADNNVTSVTDNVTSANNQTLTYDQVDRLKSASGVYGTVSSITYDSNSNRKTYGATTYTTPGLNDRMSNAGGSSITYTSTGNISAIGTSTMTYNQANQLKTATVSGTASTYTYDAFGERLKLKVGTNKFAISTYDQWGELLTEQNNAVETDYAYLDGTPIATIQPGAASIYCLLGNNLRTPQVATDSTKATVWSGNYQPFGAVTPTASITMNLRYPGQYADATGFYHNGFRDYNPSIGRYLQNDPIGIAGGMNGYNYVDQNPMSWMDPWGLLKITDPTPSVIPGYSAPCPENESDFKAVGGGIINDVASLSHQYTTTGPDGAVYYWNRAWSYDENTYHGGCPVYKQVHEDGVWGSECEYENHILNLDGPNAGTANLYNNFTGAHFTIDPGGIAGPVNGHTPTDYYEYYWLFHRLPPKYSE